MSDLSYIIVKLKTDNLAFNLLVVCVVLYAFAAIGKADQDFTEIDGVVARIDAVPLILSEFQRPTAASESQFTLCVLQDGKARRSENAEEKILPKPRPHLLHIAGDPEEKLVPVYDSQASTIVYKYLSRIGNAVAIAWATVEEKESKEWVLEVDVHYTLRIMSKERKVFIVSENSKSSPALTAKLRKIVQSAKIDYIPDCLHSIYGDELNIELIFRCKRT